MERALITRTPISAIPISPSVVRSPAVPGRTPLSLFGLASALRLAQSALEEALEAAENLGSFDRRFDVPRALGGAQRLVGNALEAVDAARPR